MMRKYLLPVILALLLLALPVTANPQYRLFVNNVRVDKPIIVIDGISYAPVRAIAEMFGARVDWIESTKTVSIRTNAGEKTAKRPPINGDAEFIEKINAALDLLEQKDFPHYVMVCENTAGIKQAAKRPDDAPPKSIASANTNAETLIHPELIVNPDYYTPLFLSGMLVHEACHHIDWKYSGETNKEREAKAQQRAAYDLLNAPQWMLEAWR